jgi:hypothetical protein
MSHSSSPPRSTLLLPTDPPRRPATILNEYRAYIDDLYELRREQSRLMRQLAECEASIGPLDTKSRTTELVARRADDVTAAIEAVTHQLAALDLELRYATRE